MAILDFELLKAFNTSNERLRELLTAGVDEQQKPVAGESKADKTERIKRNRRIDRDIDLRNKLQWRIQSRIEDGVSQQLRNWRIYAAADMARDTVIITKRTLALAMYAQGKINVESCVAQLSNCADGGRYIKVDPETKVRSVDVPRFVEMSFNLTRSIILRRWAAQTNLFEGAWPYLNYEARSTGLPAKVRADVLSQRVDIMADQYGYRHHDSQVLLDAFYYGHSVDFPRCSWETEKQWERKDFDGDPKEVRTIVTKEGVGWFNPHPTRIFWDNNHPLASINSDTGCEWIGFWDLSRYGEIRDNPQYFNRKSVGYNSAYWGGGLFSANVDYFNHYNYTLKPPTGLDTNPALGNDRKANVGYYSSTAEDSSVMVANYFEKLTPKDWGIGDYPWPVWVRFVVASDSTVVFAEIMPSTPAAYLGINESDGRQCNPSMAHDVMQYQDALSNLLTKLLMLCEAEAFKAIGVNIDALNKEDGDYIINQFRKPDYYKAPMVYGYSQTKLVNPDTGAGIKADDIIKLSEARVGTSIDVIFEAMIKLVGLVEKLMNLSPAEQGQPAPREISATESNTINTTTTSIYSAISDQYRDFRAAKKRIIYESLVCCGQSVVSAPVKDRYTRKTILAAGFKPVEDEQEDYTGEVRRQTVIGSKRNLIHDYYFSSRDTPERAVNTQAANIMVQQISMLLSIPAVLQSPGFKEKLYAMLNELFRLSGSGFDLNLQLAEGEDPSFGASELDAMKQAVQQMGQYLQQLTGQVQQNTQGLQQQEATNADQQEALKVMNEFGQHIQRMQDELNKLKDEKESAELKALELIPYDKSYPSIQRQMESRGGLVPHRDGEQMVVLAAKNGEKKAK
ncbi:MAG TPA: hypothetical protein VMX97_12320 [Hyphomicrobiaceae bacterium]|nr:hypothetical protein [Hyphomicrobiaceae bacterium]